MDLNNVNLSGRLTKDVELRVTPTGTEVVSFTLAVDDFSKEKENNTNFINCVAWNNQAKFLNQYCKKGNLLIISGRLSTRSYDRKDGTKAFVTEVVCNQVINATPKEKELTPYEQAIKDSVPTNDSIKEPEQALVYADDDLPF